MPSDSQKLFFRTVTIGLSFAGALLLTFFYPLIGLRVFHITVDTSLRMIAIRLILFGLFSGLVASCCVFGLHAVGSFLHRWRYGISAGLLVLVVLLDINGSSLNWWNGMFGGDTQTDVVYGRPQAIRSDEYAVGTPFAFSQAYNGYGYFNSIIGDRPSDMFIIKDAPVWVFAEIFRPFHWGYLLLGSSRGLSFYWFARLITLFLATYEFTLLICARSRYLAVTGAVLITFAPLTQWWFAVNSLPEMFIAIFFSIVILHRYIDDLNSWHRLGYAALIGECAGIFVLSLYPAWQIPLGYLLLVLIIWTFVSRRRAIRCARRDVMGIFVVITVTAILLGTVMHRSWPTIEATMHTAYPGQRVSTGGDLSITALFSGFVSLGYSIKEYVGLLNSSEAAGVIDFFPLGLVLFVIAEIRTRRRDVLSWLLTGYGLFLFVYMIFGFTPMMAKVTLLSMSTSTRCRAPFAVINLILALRGLYRVKGMRVQNSVYSKMLVSPLLGEKDVAVILVYGYGVLVSVMSWLDNPAYTGMITAILVALFAVGWCIALSSVYSAWGRRLWSMAVIVVILSGMSVNPIQYSDSAITDQTIVNNAKTIQSDKMGLWVAGSTDNEQGSNLAQLLVANGIPALNAVQVTPNMSAWQKLDPIGRWGKIYNRYAYVTVNIVHEEREEKFRLVAPDHIAVDVTVDDLAVLGVNYILSQRTLNAESFDGYRFVRINISSNGWILYRLEHD